jgi:beta-phosphoglucomutase-like phosphatase (HAD superfamily)
LSGVNPSGTDAERQPALLFDLDGTLVDSVYQHVLAWSASLEEAGIRLAVWRIHRRIGMSGGLFVNALSRETGRELSAGDISSLQEAHAREFLKRQHEVRPLPGARDLLQHLSALGIPVGHRDERLTTHRCAGPADARYPRRNRRGDPG